MGEDDFALADLRVVLAVIESRSYTRASHKLGISQPAVSRRISALQNRLGVTLFRRDGQKFFPTEAGIAFSERAREILDLMEDLEKSTMGISKDPRGSVAIGVPPSTGEALIKSVIPAYRKLYPNVKIRIEQGYIADLFEMLMSKTIDVALLNGEFNSASVYLEPIYHHHLGIVYPAAWKSRSPLNQRAMPKSLTMAEVSELPLYLPSEGQSLRSLVDEAFRHAGVAPRIEVEINSFLLQKAMVLEGHGCMFMSPSAGRPNDEDRLGFAAVSDADIVFTIYVAIRKFGQPTTPAKLMAALIKQHSSSVKNYLGGK